MSKENNPSIIEKSKTFFENLGTSAKHRTNRTINATQEQRAISVRKFHTEQEQEWYKQYYANLRYSYDNIVNPSVKSALEETSYLGIDVPLWTSAYRVDWIYFHNNDSRYPIFRIHIHCISKRYGDRELHLNIQDALFEYWYRSNSMGFPTPYFRVVKVRPLPCNRYDLEVMMEG